MAAKAAKKENMEAVGISGGVAYNEAIVRNIRTKLEEAGFELLTHTKVPCGDGGVSLGQACTATMKGFQVQ
jgi:hydrogenase maturation protein HypF